MNSDAFLKLSDKMKGTGDQVLSGMIKSAESKLSEHFLPKVMLITNGYGRQEIYRLLCNESSQSEILQEYLPEIDRPFYVTLNYGKPYAQEELASSEEGEYIKITATIEWDYLKGAEFAWICGFDMSNLKTSMIENMDGIILVTNATMALPQEEKDWLRNVFRSFWYGERAIVSFYSRNLVNTKEDYEALSKNVNTMLQVIDSRIGFCEDLSSIFDTAGKALWEDVTEEKHKNMVIKNCLRGMQERASELLKASKVDTEKLKAAMDKLERERKDIELSGRILLESTLENMYADLKNQIIEAADQYNEDAYNSIRNRIETTKKVEQDVDSIPTYLKAVWGNFENEVKVKFALEQDRISADLEHQMETICNRLLHMLDLEEGSELMQQLSMEVGFTAYTMDANDAPRASREKLISKGLMIASIALAFVNPVWGLAAFVTTRFFKRSRDNNSEDLRRKVLDELYGECSSIKEKVVEQIAAVIDDAKKNFAKNIGNVYSDMINSMIASIVHFMEQIKQLQMQEELLWAIVEEEIPAIRNLME